MRLSIPSFADSLSLFSARNVRLGCVKLSRRRSITANRPIFDLCGRNRTKSGAKRPRLQPRSGPSLLELRGIDRKWRLLRVAMSFYGDRIYLREC